MRVVNAEPQLIADFIDEIEVAAATDSLSFTVHLGRHPLLGKVVVIKGKEGDGLIVEVDE